MLQESIIIKNERRCRNGMSESLQTKKDKSDGKYTKPHPPLHLFTKEQRCRKQLCIFTITFILPYLCTFWRSKWFMNVILQTLIDWFPYGKRNLTHHPSSQKLMILWNKLYKYCIYGVSAPMWRVYRLSNTAEAQRTSEETTFCDGSELIHSLENWLLVRRNCVL